MNFLCVSQYKIKKKKKHSVFYVHTVEDNGLQCKNMRVS